MDESLSGFARLGLPAPNQLQAMTLARPCPSSYTMAEFSTETGMSAGSSSMMGQLATTSPVSMLSASRLTVSKLSVKKTSSLPSEGEQPPPHARPSPVVAAPSRLSFAPALS